MKFEDAPDRKRTTCWLRRIAVLALAIPFLSVVFAERGSAAKRLLGVDEAPAHGRVDSQCQHAQYVQADDRHRQVEQAPEDGAIDASGWT